MKDIPLSTFGSDTIETFLSQIPFFNDLSIHDNQQYNLLLENSKIIEIDPGEQIIKKGEMEKTFYFLLKGILEIHADENARGKSINQLTPGQVFGALAVINDQERIASVVSSAESPATVFATDISIFGAPDDFSQINLDTKLSLLRIVINNTRWKIEVYKMNSPNHPLVSNLDEIKRFSGEKDTIEELLDLTEQSKKLALLLNDWNESLDKGETFTPEGKKDNKIFSILRSVRNRLK